MNFQTFQGSNSQVRYSFLFYSIIFSFKKIKKTMKILAFAQAPVKLH
jgi:hypothetical protein